MKPTCEKFESHMANAKPMVVTPDKDHNKSAELSLCYDFKQTFTAEDLALEPVPAVCWVHLSCAYWVPEVSITPTSYKGPISSLDLIDKRRFRLLCSICKERGTGCCVQCSKGKCKVAFHVECARLAGFTMEKMWEDEKSASLIYCEKHRPLELRKITEQQKKCDSEEIVNFCRIAKKCSKGEQRGERRRKTKLFTKAERKNLIIRVRRLCKKYASLTINIGKRIQDSGQLEYRVIQSTGKISYNETLDKQKFPWNHARFDKFSAGSCYKKYTELVPNEATFSKDVMLQVQPDQIENEKIEVRETPIMRYCYCKKMEYEMPGAVMVSKMGA